MLRRTCVMIAAALVFAPVFLLAQEFRSTLSGRILDPQNAAIPGAQVVATNAETGARYQATSGADGIYVIPFLAPGTYSVSAQAKGFKRFVRQGLRISTNERVPLDMKLDVGAPTETVMVTAETPLLQTATASVGQVIGSQQIDITPLAGRTPLMLAQLAFGVITIAEPQYARPFDNQAPSDFSMGGAPVRSNELLLDGAPNMSGSAWKSSGAENRVAYNPPLDAVAEVKVEAFQVDAAYGHSGGGTVNVVMRGGTNQLHGSAYEYNQVSALMATPFFNNAANIPKPVTRYNQWGLTSGGPIMIPKLVDGRNRMFFFVSYEGIRDSKPVSDISTVPTEAERKGDFSELLKLGSNYQIYDPATGVREGSRIRRQPFQNNIIPKERLNPIALNYLQFYPMPNRVGGADGEDNYFSPTNVERGKFASFLGRLDFAISDRHKLFGNFRWNEGDNLRGNALGGAPDGPTGFNGTFRTNWGTLVDDVYAFSPSLVLNTRLNWTRFEEPRPNMSRGFDPTTLGFPQYIVTNSTQLILPPANITGYTSIGSGGGNTLPSDIFQIFSSVTKVTGKHTLKMGVDLRRYIESTTVFGNSSGSYTFSTNWTRGPLDNSSASPLGQGFASFLLGVPTSGSYDVNTSRTNHADYYSLFMQDDIRLLRNLTVNLGLRFERDTPTTERYNRSVNGFDFTTPNPINDAARAAYALKPIADIPVDQFRAIGGLTYASAQNPELYQTKSGYFSPRAGIAWKPEILGQKSVIRAGFGVFIFPLTTRGVDLTGYNQSSSFVATLDGYLTPATTFSNPFPNGIQKGTGSSLGLRTYLGKSVSFYNPNPLNPYSMRWNLAVQRELAPSLVVELGYTGNHALHLPINRQLNFVPRQYLSTSNTRDQLNINYLTANVANPFAGLMPGTTLDGTYVQRSQLLLPYPQFTGVTMEGVNEGSSFFHEFATRVEKRFSGGFSLLANYSYSKLLERRSRLNDSDPFLEKRLAQEDRGHVFVISGTLDLPIGEGRKFQNGVNPILNAVIGGWTTTAVFTLASGQPAVWGNVIYLGGDLNWDPRNIDHVFDTTRFNTNSAQQLQWNIRTFPSVLGNYRYDFINNMDASLLKNFTLPRETRLQFRFEAFNAFNRPLFSSSFNPPGMNPVSSSFGTSRTQRNLQRRIQMALRLMW